MTDAERDPVLRRAIDELQRMPAVDAEKMRRVVQAAAAARVADADEPIVAELTGRSRAVRWLSAAGLVAAAAIIGFVARGTWTSNNTSRGSLVATTAMAPLTPASNSSSDVVPIPQQFVVSNVTAHRISVVGDFNEWNPATAPMTRSADGALWSAIIPILPGRHLYGFMIDDSLFTLDPRAPKARDPEFGSEGSVVIVGRP